MIINSKNINLFGAKCEKKNISHGANSIELTNSLDKVTEGEESKALSQLSIRLRFEGRDRDIINKNISNFLLETKKCEIKFRNLSNTYLSYYLSHSVEDSEVDEWVFLELEFYCIEQGQRVENTFLNNGVINNLGNLSCDAIVEVTSAIDIIDVTLKGLADTDIILKNLKANKTVVVNGEDGTVLEEGRNKFQDTEFWEFPRLLPGLNNIKSNKDSLTIKVKYKPKWN